MNKNLFGKGLVVGIIVLFVTVGVQPVIAKSQVLAISKPISL